MDLFFAILLNWKSFQRNNSLGDFFSWPIKSLQLKKNMSWFCSFKTKSLVTTHRRSYCFDCFDSIHSGYTVFRRIFDRRPHEFRTTSFLWKIIISLKERILWDFFRVFRIILSFIHDSSLHESARLTLLLTARKSLATSLNWRLYFFLFFFFFFVDAAASASATPCLVLWRPR